MKVFLLQAVANIGKKGDILEVSDGYARNFLIPRQMAAQANSADAARAKSQIQAQHLEQLKKQKDKELVLQKLQGRTLTFQSEAASSGHLYAAITAKDIAQTLQRDTGIEIAPERIKIEKAIKQLGKHEAEFTNGEKKVKFKVVVIER